MGFHVFSIISIVFKQEPQSFHAEVVNRMTGLVEVVGDRFVPVMFDVSHLLIETGFKGASSYAYSYADVEFGAMDDVHDVRQAVELFGDVRLRFRPWILVAVQMNGHVLHLGVLHRVVPGGLVVGCRSLDVTDVGITFVCDHWWLIEDLSHLSRCLQKTPVGQKDSAHTMNGRVVKETDDESLFSSYVIVRSQSKIIIIIIMRISLAHIQS